VVPNRDSQRSIDAGERPTGASRNLAGDLVPRLARRRDHRGVAAAVQRRHEADRGEQTLDDQLHALGTDRSRLAAELDAAAARNRALESANREVAQRLDAAIDTIRSVLAANAR
jgi:hypothetical protein